MFKSKGKKELSKKIKEGKKPSKMAPKLANKEIKKELPVITSIDIEKTATGYYIEIVSNKGKSQRDYTDNETCSLINQLIDQLNQ